VSHVHAPAPRTTPDRLVPEGVTEGNPRQERRPGLGQAAEICGDPQMTSDARRCLVSTIVLLGLPFALAKRVPGVNTLAMRDTARCYEVRGRESASFDRLRLASTPASQRARVDAREFACTIMEASQIDV